MTIAFLFPGQGADIARVGPPWLAHSPGTRDLLARAAQQAGVPLDRLFAEGGRALERTEVQQPALTALCLGIHGELARRGVRPDIVAGHSLGEIAAAAAAGCMTAADAVAVAVTRGRLMGREAAKHPGGMLALTTPDRRVAEEAIALARQHGIAALAAHNTPEQWVVAGTRDALRAVAARYSAVPVSVAGPWHTDAMDGAVAELRAALHTAIRGPLDTPLLCNRTGMHVLDPDDLPELLAGQLTHSVEWVSTMRTLDSGGATDVVILGPSRVLRGLVRRNLGESVALHAAELPADLDAIEEALTS